MTPESDRDRLRADVHLVSAIATIGLAVVTVAKWIRTWPGATVLTGLGVLGIASSCLLLWQTSIAPVVWWQRIIFERRAAHRGRIMVLLMLLYPLLLLPVAVSFALGSLIQSEAPTWAAILMFPLLLFAFGLMRIATLLLSKIESRRVGLLVETLRAGIPSFWQALVGLVLAASFWNPWSARGVGVLFMLWLAVRFAGWAARRYGVEATWTLWPLMFPPRRMLTVYAGAIPDGRRPGKHSSTETGRREPDASKPTRASQSDDAP